MLTAISYAQSEVIELLVGPKRKHFLHKELLTNNSSYFRALFSGNLAWKESKSDRVQWKDWLDVSGERAIEI